MAEIYYDIDLSASQANDSLNEGYALKQADSSGSNGQFLQKTSNGLAFADVLGDAASDNKIYGRKNGAWSEVVAGGSVDVDGTTIDFNNNDELYAIHDHQHSNMSVLNGISSSDVSAWDAKLDDASSDGKTYGRKNGAWSEVTGGGTDIYSLDETRIGTWIDRPLYRKVISLNGISGSTVNIPHGVPNIGGAIKVFGFISHTNGMYMIPSIESTSNYVTVVFVDATKIQLKIGGWTNAFTNCPTRIVIEYTKN